MSYVREDKDTGPIMTMLPKDRPINRAVYREFGKQARDRGDKRDTHKQLPYTYHAIEAWLDGWDARDQELLNSVGYQRRMRAIERVERKRAAKIVADVQESIGKVLYRTASKGY